MSSNFDTIQLGELSIQAPYTWQFHSYENMILGRPDSRFGTLQISLAFRHDAKHDDEHGALCAAMEFASVTDSSSVSSPEKLEIDGKCCGHFDLKENEKNNRYFYTLTTAGLIISVFQSKQPDLTPEQWREVEAIVFSADY